MAGLQSNLKYFIFNNSLRLLKRSNVGLQSSRGKHILVFRIDLPKNTVHVNKSRLLLNTNLKDVYRLASTNIATTEPVEVAVGAADVKNAGLNFANKSEGTNVLSSEFTSEAAANEVATPLGSSIVIDEASLPPIPSVEEPLAAAIEFVSTGLKEPSFQSIGLGSYWPSGLIQQLLEFLHIGLDLPWWGAITIVTIICRIAVFPLALKARKNAVNMNNCLPQLQALNEKLAVARETGNYYYAAVCTQDLQNFMKEKKLNPFTSLMPALFQAPIFLSVFWGLKNMANAPVESMKTGGLFWFQDLTVPDPYFILPVGAACTLLLIFEVGADGIDLASIKYQWIKYAVRIFPFLLLPFTTALPQAVLWYWFNSNVVSLIQVSALRIPAVSKFLNLPKSVPHSRSTTPKRKKGMIEGFREGVANAKLTRELEDRERLNAVTFENAGRGPVPRTFKKNPKLVSQNAPVKLSGK